MKRSPPGSVAYVLFRLGTLGELEPESSVKRKRARDVRDDNAERIEPRGHAASA
jgi:hypothetical protein